MFHPPPQSYCLFFGIRQILNDGTQLYLAALKSGIKPIFAISAQETVAPVSIVSGITVRCRIFKSRGVFVWVFVVSGIYLYLRFRHIDIRRIFDQLAHTLETLQPAHIA